MDMAAVLDPCGKPSGTLLKTTLLKAGLPVQRSICQERLLFVCLAHLLLGRIPEHERGDLVAHIHIRNIATGLALEGYVFLFDFDLGLRIATSVALHKLLDEALQQLKQLAIVMCSIDN